MDNCLMLLGLSKKAGFLEVGDDCVSDAVELVKARCILSAADASDGSKRKAEFLAEESRVPHIVLPYTKAELGIAVGRGTPGILAITDIGMAASFVSKLAQTDETYGEYAEVLSVKLKRAKERRAGRQKEDNNKIGKRRTNK
jgi:ribosomal protein L7Ae-like RNA K-turn-binding protein